jgi:metal-responsive CopG/Arc/MetJ family transcriptional regulator
MRWNIFLDIFVIVVYNLSNNCGGVFFMRVNINLSEELLNQIDEKARALYISRSAYIATALSQKLQSDKMMDNMPEIMQTMKEAVRIEKEKALLFDETEKG